MPPDWPPGTSLRLAKELDSPPMQTLHGAKPALKLVSGRYSLGYPKVGRNAYSG